MSEFKREQHYFPVCSFCRFPHDRLEPCPVADKKIDEIVSCPSCAALRARVALVEKWANKLEISMHRVDRDGNPQYDAWALSSLRAALAAYGKEAK